ncbi:zinc finger protein [Spatholobus suberectus]|nr:zinc finger protein [Spatholobus suberectus]
MDNSPSSASSMVTLSRCIKNKIFCFCGVPCKIQTSGTSKNHGRKFFGCGRFDGYTKYCNYFLWCDEDDEVKEMEEMIALVVAQRSDTLILQEKIEKMNTDLSVLIKTVETMNEDLIVLSKIVRQVRLKIARFK